MVALMGVDILWNLSLQNAQALKAARASCSKASGALAAWRGVSQQVVMVLFMMVAAFAGLYFVTSRLVLRPIDALRTAAKSVGGQVHEVHGLGHKLVLLGRVLGNDEDVVHHVQQQGGTLAVPDPRARPRDEITELSGEFGRMARDLEALYADLEGQVRSKTDDLMVLNPSGSRTDPARRPVRRGIPGMTREMRAAWDFVDRNQNVINRAEDGSFRTKHLVCVVAAKSDPLLANHPIMPDGKGRGNS